MKVVAVDLGDEVDLRELSSDYGVPPPATWEDPLVLSHEMGKVFVYSFGVMVGIGINVEELIKLAKDLFGKYGYVEEMELLEGKSVKPGEDTVVVEKIDEGTTRVVAFALAQSVALTRIEKTIDEMEEEVEKVLARKNPFKGKEALNKALEILRVKHELISDLMILDRPSLTWESDYLDEIYDRVSKMYELGRRYRVTETKLKNLFETVQVLLSVSAESKANFLELLIVVLIAVEILLWLKELFF